MTTQQKLEKLKSLNKEYPLSDKGKHLYWESYAEYLPEKVRTMLEIGVAQGDSALIWFKFFGRNCDISLLDLFDNEDFASTRWARERFFTPYQMDQSDVAEMVKQIHTQFQLIVDDGSHRSDHMIITWKHLFSNNLRSKGLYVIEDLETCKETFFRGGLSLEYEDTALWMLKNYNKTGRFVNPYLTDGEASHYESIVEKVEVVNDKIAFIWKR